MMFLVFGSVTQEQFGICMNLLDDHFVIPDDEQIRKGANCCNWLRGA